jgi:hypothetical protein
MEHFEEQLRKSLRRENPSANFEARVADRVAGADRRRSWWPSILAWPQFRWAAVATMCLLILGGIAYRRERQMRRAEGEAAKQQVMIALRIAGAKMKLARTKVQGLSQR